MLKLKLQCFGHLMQRVCSLEKTLMLGKMKAAGEGVTEDRMVGWHHQLNGHGFKQTLGDGKGQKTWRAAVYGVTKSQIRLSN